MKRKLTMTELAVTAAIVMIGLICTNRIPPEPQFCALCHAVPYHAPCLVNIQTGGVTELTIYEPHPVKAGELAQSQSGEYMKLAMSNGLFVYAFTDCQEAHTTVPVSKGKLNETLFCMSCRKLLNSAKSTYVIADLYDAENIQIYDIADGLCCQMRCYEVTGTFSEDRRKVGITNTGYYRDHLIGES